MSVRTGRFALLAQNRVEYGYDGYVYAEAMGQEFLEYCQEAFGAELFPFGYPPHPYRFIIDEDAMRRIVGVYDYEYSDKEI